MSKRKPESKDLYNFNYPGDISVSPDGAYVAYTVTRLDKEKDEGKTDLHLYDVAGAVSRRLTYGGKEGKAHFSPDSKRLAFVSGRNEKAQIYIMDLARGGEPWQLPTKEAVGNSVVWFPCGTKIAYSAKVFSQTEEWVPYPGAPEYDADRLKGVASKPHADKKPDPDKKENLVKVITRFSYRRDGAGYHGDLREQVFVTPVPASPPVATLEPAASQATKGDYDHRNVAISPDGKYLLVSARRDAEADWSTKRDLWLFAVGDNSCTMLYDAPGPADNPLFSRCGGYVAFLGHDGSSGLSTSTGLYILPVEEFMTKLAAGESPAPLTKSDARHVTERFDRTAVGGFWHDDAFVFSMADRGQVHAYAAHQDSEPTALLTAAQTSYFGLCGASGTLAYIKGGFDLTEEVCVHRDGVEVMASACNTSLQQELDLSPARHFVYNSDDGQEIDGWTILPQDFDAQEKYPLMLFIHGGPHAWYGPRFMLDAQVFAAQGYVVLMTNPRGSESYGQHFADVIDRNWGDLDYKDVMAGVKAALALGILDEKRLFAQGWSYGGYLTCWIVTQTDLFKAVCSGAPVSNMMSGFGTSDITLADEHEYGGNSWEGAAHLLKHSAISYADRVKTPFMLMHGENDLRCPVSQSEEFYIALRRQGKDAVMIRYPGEYHGLRRPMHRLDKLERQVAWFNYHKNL